MGRSKICLSENVIESDAYYGLSHESQALYTHLPFVSDSNGITNKVQTCLRATGCSKEAFQELLDAGFVLDCENGYYAITDWWTMNNKSQMRNVPPCELVNKEILFFDGEQYKSRYTKVKPCISHDIDMSYTCERHDVLNRIEVNRSEMNRNELNINENEINADTREKDSFTVEEYHYPETCSKCYSLGAVYHYSNGKNRFKCAHCGEYPVEV